MRRRRLTKGGVAKAELGTGPLVAARETTWQARTSHDARFRQCGLVHHAATRTHAFFFFFIVGSGPSPFGVKAFGMYSDQFWSMRTVP